MGGLGVAPPLCNKPLCSHTHVKTAPYAPWLRENAARNSAHSLAPASISVAISETPAELGTFLPVVHAVVMGDKAQRPVGTSNGNAIDKPNNRHPNHQLLPS